MAEGERDAIIRASYPEYVAASTQVHYVRFYDGSQQQIDYAAELIEQWVLSPNYRHGKCAAVDAQARIDGKLNDGLWPPLGVKRRNTKRDTTDFFR